MRGVTRSLVSRGFFLVKNFFECYFTFAMSKKEKDQMQIEFLKVTDLIPYARNSRTHSEEQIIQIASSIKEFGFTNPVLIGTDNDIIAGHGRVMAANKLKLTKVPCIRLGYLTETQKRAYVIADNKLALNAGWDEELLSIELIDLRSEDYDLNLTGFNGDEIEDYLNSPEFEPGTEDDQGKLDELEPKIVKCPHCSMTFDSRGHEQE